MPSPNGHVKTEVNIHVPVSNAGGQNKKIKFDMVLNRFSRFSAVDYVYLLILCKAKAVYLPCVNLH